MAFVTYNRRHPLIELEVSGGSEPVLIILRPCVQFEHFECIHKLSGGLRVVNQLAEFIEINLSVVAFIISAFVNVKVWGENDSRIFNLDFWTGCKYYLTAQKSCQ